MKTRKLLLSVATAALVLSLPMAAGQVNLPFAASAAQAQELRVSFRLFFDQLEPHGVWVRHPRHRYVWCPDVDVRWRPYTKGRWQYLRDYGWYFHSNEPFAWAVYHYGRWFRDARLGWCWVPGRNWAPAWVSWRHSGKVVGWAPLPPEEDGFQVRVSVSVRVDDFDEDDWFFVPSRHFLEPDLSVRIRFGSVRPRLVEETRYLGPVIIQNNIVINNIININYIEAETDQEVEVVEATVVEDPEATTADTGQDNTINVFAPRLEEPTEEVAPEQAVEPEQAEAELPQAGENLEEADAAADAEAEATAEADIEAELEAEPEVELEVPPEAQVEGEAAVEGEAEAEAGAEGEDPAAVTECPEGQELVEGVCVPIEGEAGVEAEAGAETEAGAEAETAPAEEAAPTEETAPAEEAAPTEEEAAPAGEEAPVIECPEGQELIDGVCVPIEQPATEETAPAEEAAPAEETAPAEEAAPEEEAVPAEEAPAEPPVCPEGFVLHEGQCITIEQARELGIIIE
jgi:hypothetical protein